MSRLATFALFAAALAAAVAGPLAEAARSPAMKGGRYVGHVATKGSVTLAVTASGQNFAAGRLDLVLRGAMGRGSCAGPAHVTLTPTTTPQITPGGTFSLTGTFAFREASLDPQAFRGTAHAAVRGAFSDRGRLVSGTVELTTVGTGMTCRSGVVHFTAALV